MKSNTAKVIVLSLIAFCTLFLSSIELKAQCTASIDGSNNPYPGDYTFSSSMNPNLGNVWYAWDFGDGNTAYTHLDSIHHIYSFSGTYYVCVTATDSANGGCTNTSCQWLTVATTICDITPQFTSMDMGGGNVMFTDNSIDNSGTITSWYWIFGDGGNSSNQNPSHTYATNGVYGVMLILHNSLGCSDTAYQQVTVNSAGGGCFLYGAISIDTSSAANNIIVFTGNATGSVGPYHYSFYFPGGNPSYSQTQITTVQYPAPGTYQVCMSVYDANWICYDSICTTLIYGGVGFSCSGYGVAVTGTQTSNFTWDFMATTVLGTAPYTYVWTMNGGSSSCGYNQQMLCGNFTLPGTYQVCCDVTDANGCNGYNCYTVVVQPPSCTANFYVYGYSDTTYLYNYSSASASATYFWDFGDGTTATNNTLSQYFPHHYTTAGSYTICLYLSDPVNNCYDTLCQNIYACGLDAVATYTMNGNIITVTATVTGAYNTYGWNSQTQSYPNTFTITDTLATNGYYYYYFNVSNTVTGCYDSAYIVVNTNFPTQNTISGHLFNDLNGNGIQDTGEPPIANNYVIVAGSWVQTNSNGDYSVNVADGTWSVSLWIPSGWIQTFPVSPSSYSVSVSGGMNLTGVDFGMRNSYTSVCGFVYNDANQNGFQDVGEVGLSGIWVQVGIYWALTNASGYYTVNIALGTYNVHLYQVPAMGVLITPASGSYTVTTSTAGVAYCGNDFGIYFNPSLQDLEVALIPYTTVTPGFPAWYDISYCNNGGVPVNGTLTMNFDSYLIFVSASPTPSSVDNVNHILTWNLGVINPGVCGWIWVDFDAATSTPIGVDAFNAVTIQPISGDDVPSNNIDTTHQITNASWDPNEKEVSPHGEGSQGLIHATQQLDYTIHFQNTGTAPAVNVEIVDTLSDQLDLNTFEVVASSHPMVATMDETNRVVRFFFNNIMLPDSGTDMQGSVGSVKYKILPNTGIADGSVINNFADIYFDFNPPVRTQTTLNTIDYNLSAPPVSSVYTLSIYPNPASEQLTVYSSGLKGNSISIVNVLGKEVLNSKLNFNSEIVNLKSLSKGVYFVKIISSNGETLEVRKLTVQ